MMPRHMYVGGSKLAHFVKESVIEWSAIFRRIEVRVRMIVGRFACADARYHRLNLGKELTESSGNTFKY
jgi:hypothetical protein